MKYLPILLLAFGSVLSAATLPASTSYVVTLNWMAPASSPDPVVGYDVYRSVSGKKSFTELNAALITGTSYSDLALLYGISYDYYATSVDAVGVQSVPSNTVTVQIPFVPYTPVVGTIK